MLIPKRSSEVATPANSAMMFVRFRKTSTIMTKKVIRRPNSSRIRSDNPLPVTAPMREHISCVTMRATVIGSSVQRGR